MSRSTVCLVPNGRTSHQPRRFSHGERERFGVGRKTVKFVQREMLFHDIPPVPGGHLSANGSSQFSFSPPSHAARAEYTNQWFSRTGKMVLMAPCYKLTAIRTGVNYSTVSSVCISIRSRLVCHCRGIGISPSRLA